MVTRPVNSNPNQKREEPNTSDEAKPHLTNVWNSIGGHKVIIKNEEGKEAVEFYHKSGSAILFQPDGKIVMKTVGEQRTEMESGLSVTIGQNADVHVTGHTKISVSGGKEMEIVGDMDIVVGGAITLIALEEMNFTSKGNMTINAGKDLNVNVTGNMKTDVQGTNDTVTKGKLTHTTESDARYESNAKMNIGSGSDMNIQATRVDINKAGGTSGFTNAVTSSHDSTQQAILKGLNGEDD